MTTNFPEMRVDGRGRLVPKKPKKIKPALLPEPDDAVAEVVHLDDFIARNGRPHKMVRATWNYPRQLSMTDIMILGYFHHHKCFVGRDGGCIGFEGRKVDYDDYAEDYKKRMRRRRK
jgi:hypothetical protein